MKKSILLSHILLAATLIMLSSCWQHNQIPGRLSGSKALYNTNKLKKGEFIRDFIICGPFPNPLPEGVTNYFHTDRECTGFARDHFANVGGETAIRPYPGFSFEYEDGSLYKWEELSLENDIADLRKVYTPSNGVVAYAGIYLESSSKQELLFGLGSNDGVKAWLNGELLLKEHKPRTVIVDDEYLRLKLKKGLNFLMLKIDQGFGGWGFTLRPVSNEMAWESIKQRLDIAMNSEFRLIDDHIVGNIGDKNLTGMLKNLPLANVEFTSLDGKHKFSINAPLGTELKLPVKKLPGIEYKVKISFSQGELHHSSYTYLNAGENTIDKVRELLEFGLPPMPLCVMADNYKNYFHTVEWLDHTNKLWGHPYGYRRYLDGLKNALNGAKQLNNLKDPFDAVFPEPAEREIAVGQCSIDNSWKIYDPGSRDDIISARLNSFWQENFSKAPEYINKTEEKNTIVLQLEEAGKKGSYSISIEKERIIIKAPERQGLWYGINSLLQAMNISTKLPAGKITDCPAYPVRSTLASAEGLSREITDYVDTISSLRYNKLYIYSSAYSDLDDKEKLKNIKEVFNYCRSRYIEPVPNFETFGAATITRLEDPSLDEGIFRQNIEHKSDSLGNIIVKASRILDCETSTIHLYNNKGKELKRDIDYKLLSSEPPVVKMLKKEFYKSSFLLSYDEVDFSLFPHPASCPSDPRGWKIQERVISSVIKELRPESLHISQDEAGLINKCSRCLARELSNKEIMIDQIQRVYSIIRKYDPHVNICIWGDLFNDLQNAPVLGVEGAIEGLPIDIAVHDWSYVAVYHSQRKKTIDQMDFFLNRGYKTGGVAWFEPANVLDILEAGRDRGEQFHGIMHTAWSGFDHSLYTVAEANWTGKTIMGDIDF